MTLVFARRGPLAGQRVDIPDEDVKAAVAEDGWATELVPGNVLEIDAITPYDPKWKIPGYEPPPDTKKGKDREKNADDPKSNAKK